MMYVCMCAAHGVMCPGGHGVQLFFGPAVVAHIHVIIKIIPFRF